MQSSISAQYRYGPGPNAGYGAGPQAGYGRSTGAGGAPVPQLQQGYPQEQPMMAAPPQQQGQGQPQNGYEAQAVVNGGPALGPGSSLQAFFAEVCHSSWIFAAAGTRH